MRSQCMALPERAYVFVILDGRANGLHGVLKARWVFIHDVDKPIALGHIICGKDGPG